MRINWLNAAVATIIGALLAWWLWEMGVETTQSWLLACVGGTLTWIGLLLGMSSDYDNPRSGTQVKIVLYGMATIVFLASCIYSFFPFTPVGYCVPVGIFALFCIVAALRVYRTKM